MRRVIRSIPHRTPARAVGHRRKRALRGVNVACVLAAIIAVSLWQRIEPYGWGVFFACGLTTGTHCLYLAMAHRGRALWPRGDGSPRCTKCRYPIEADYTACPECGLALTPEKVEASRFVWMDRRNFTVLLVLAVLAYSASFLALGLMLRSM